MARFVYVGSETRKEGGHRKEGITVYQMDRESGSLTLVQEAESGENPSFLALHPNRKFLYAINEVREGRATSFAIDPDSGRLKMLNTAMVKGLGPCYISIDPTARWACVANYGGGSLSVLPLRGDGTIGDAVDTVQHNGHGDDPDRQEGPHAHSITSDPIGKYMLAADLGTNQVYVYTLTEHGKLVANDPPSWLAEPGAGPRHLAFHPNGKVLYISNELNNTVTACRWQAEGGRLERFQTLSTLPADFTAYSSVADIHLTPDGKFLYVSNRGHNSLAVYRVSATDGRLEPVGFVSTGGNWPRNFTLDAEGKFLLVANQESHTLVGFKINLETGMPEPLGMEIAVHKPMFVTIADL